jgi:hypothetical protein
MTETVWLTGAFLAVGAPLYVTVGIIGASDVRARRRAMLLRRSKGG